jgi:uncharacterized Zn finger protein
VHEFGFTRPRDVAGGIKARSRSGRIGSTWWSQRWISILDSFGWSNRLGRGQHYARRGQVLDFTLAAGRVTAKVQGSRPNPYKIEIKLKTLSPKQWETAVAVMGSQAAFVANLLGGALLPEVEEAFRRANVPLFPGSRRDFDADCSCPDTAEVCKHIAAVHYILAEQFDRDPFMIFALRGRSRQEVLDALRKVRGGAAAEAPRKRDEPAEPMTADGFWTIGPGFAQVRAAPKPPDVELAIFKRLGEPLFAKESPERMRQLQALYRAISVWALEAAGQ